MCHACGVSSFCSLPKLLTRAVALGNRCKLDVFFFRGWTVSLERFNFVGRRVKTLFRREVVVLKSRSQETSRGTKT